MSLREDGKADANAEIYQISAIWYILTNFNLYGFRPSIRTPDMAKPVHKYPHKHPHKFVSGFASDRKSIDSESGKSHWKQPMQH